MSRCVAKCSTMPTSILFSFRFDTEGISRDLLKSMDADENLFGLDWEGEISTDDEGVYMMVRPVDGVFSLVVQ